MLNVDVRCLGFSRSWCCFCQHVFNGVSLLEAEEMQPKLHFFLPKRNAKHPKSSNIQDDLKDRKPKSLPQTSKSHHEAAKTSKYTASMLRPRNYIYSLHFAVVILAGHGRGVGAVLALLGALGGFTGFTLPRVGFPTAINS